MKAKRRHRQEVSRGNTAHQESCCPPWLAQLCTTSPRPRQTRTDMELLTGDTRLACRNHPVPVHRQAPPVPARHPALFLHRQAHPRQATGHQRATPEPIAPAKGRLHAPVGQCTGGRLRPLRRRRTQWARLDARRWRQVLHLNAMPASCQLPTTTTQASTWFESARSMSAPARARRPLD